MKRLAKLAIATIAFPVVLAYVTARAACEFGADLWRELRCVR